MRSRSGVLANVLDLAEDVLGEVWSTPSAPPLEPKPCEKPSVRFEVRRRSYR